MNNKKKQDVNLLAKLAKLNNNTHSDHTIHNMYIWLWDIEMIWDAGSYSSQEAL